MNLELSGIIAYPITPFTREDKLDMSAFEEVLNNLIQANADTIAILGSAGENFYLSDSEWESILKFSAAHLKGKLPLVVGVCEGTTANAIAKAKKAEQENADALMVIPSAYWKLNDEEILQYYQEISKSTRLPIILYNNPATSGVDMKPELILRIYNEVKNVQYVKESTGDLRRIHRIQELSNYKLPIFSGSNATAYEALMAGATGWCTAAPNIIREAPKQLYLAIKASKLDIARSLFRKQIPLLTFITERGLTQTIKAAFRILGKDYGLARKPLLDLSRDEKEYLEKLLIPLQAAQMM